MEKPTPELPKDRLKQARQEAGYGSPSEAARLSNGKLNKNTWISHENGHRDISRKAAEKYGRFLDVDPGWILYGGVRVRAIDYDETDPSAVLTGIAESLTKWASRQKKEGTPQK